MNPVPKFVRTDITEAERDLDRYLELADTLLNTKKQEHQGNTD